MANFPMIPMTWNLDDSTVVICNGSRLVIGPNGELHVEGSVKDAALGLIKYVVDQHYTPGLVSFEINKALRIEVDDGFHLEYVKPNKPAVFDELAREFSRIAKMRAFW